MEDHMTLHGMPVTERELRRLLGKLVRFRNPAVPNLYEYGTITHYNEHYLFVRFWGDTHSKAVDIRLLEFNKGDEPNA
jgi:hypothetical protein